MKNLKEKLGQVNYFDSIIDSKALDINDYNSPSYLEVLTWYSYLAYLKNNEILAKEILIPFEKISFDGNYDKWSWIEKCLVLLSRIYRENGQIENSKLCTDKILETLDFGNEEVKNRIKKKAFNRRLNGELLSLDKVEKAKGQNNKELEVLYLLVNLTEYIFIREMNNGEIFTDEYLEIKISDIVEKIKNIIL